MSTPELLQALQDATLYPHPVARFALLETHISWVLLTGPFAYKIKKPVDLGFLDFSTLAARRDCCEQELRLNRRFAPELYRAVIPITGTPAAPHLGGDGEAIEYAVQMVEFPQQALLDGVLKRGELTAGDIDRLADRIAALHAACAVAPAGSPFGEVDLVFHPVRENFSQLAPLVGDPRERARLERLRDWSISRFQESTARLRQRKADGRIRECHGDLHLGNLVRLDGDITPFDCIEFSPRLRWIDVVSDLAFLAMDLVEHDAEPLAHRLVNRYLEVGGDYHGAALLPFYRVYRALVRAKVAALRGAQQHADPAELHRYLAFAERLSRPSRPWLVLMHGLSGSGKSHVSAQLLERLGAVRLRSDVERKRLAGLPIHQAAPDGAKAGLYAPASTERTYDRLVALATDLLDGGTPVIVDATSLRRSQRRRFAELAATRGIPFAIVVTEAERSELAHRLARRACTPGEPSDADDAVVTLQEAVREPLGNDELRCAVAAGAELALTAYDALADLGVTASS